MSIIYNHDNKFKTGHVISLHIFPKHQVAKKPEFFEKVAKYATKKNIFLVFYSREELKNWDIFFWKLNFTGKRNFEFFEQNEKLDVRFEKILGRMPFSFLF